MLSDLRKCTGHTFYSQQLIILLKNIFVFYISYFYTGLCVIYDELVPITAFLIWIEIFWLFFTNYEKLVSNYFIKPI